jgi:hypothetical protein
LDALLVINALNRVADAEGEAPGTDSITVDVPVGSLAMGPEAGLLPTGSLVASSAGYEPGFGLERPIGPPVRAEVQDAFLAPQDAWIAADAGSPDRESVFDRFDTEEAELDEMIWDLVGGADRTALEDATDQLLGSLFAEGAAAK